MSNEIVGRDSLLLRDHDCEREPDKDGRITPECSKCWEDAHTEGAHLGRLLGASSVAEVLRTQIKKDFDPLATDDKDEAMRKWENAKAFVAMVDAAEAIAKEDAYKESRIHIDHCLLRVMTADEHAAYLARTK